MKKFLTYSLLFIIPLLGFWILIEVFYRTTPNNYTYKNDQLKTYYKDAKTLVLGDSHAFYGLNPEFFENTTYNVSNVSQSLYFDKLLFEKHVDSFPNLKNIVLTIAYTTLSEEDDQLEMIWRKYFYANQMELEVPLISNFNPKKYSLAFSRRLSDTYKVYQDVKEKGSLITSYPNGFITTNLVDDRHEDLDRVAKIVARKHEDGLMDFEENTRRLQDIIEACKKRRIQVYLVSFPLNKRYLELVNPNKIDKTIETCKSLSKANSNANYINLIRHELFEDADFFDANHLNTKGAEKCSKLLSELID